MLSASHKQQSILEFGDTDSDTEDRLSIIHVFFSRQSDQLRSLCSHKACFQVTNSAGLLQKGMLPHKLACELNITSKIKI